MPAVDGIQGRRLICFVCPYHLSCARHTAFAAGFGDGRPGFLCCLFASPDCMPRLPLCLPAVPAPDQVIIGVGHGCAITCSKAVCYVIFHLPVVRGFSRCGNQPHARRQSEKARTGDGTADLPPPLLPLRACGKWSILDRDAWGMRITRSWRVSIRLGTLRDFVHHRGMLRAVIFVICRLRSPARPRPQSSRFSMAAR